MRFLDVALSGIFARVIIITNAETGWVEQSSAKFLPAINAKYRLSDPASRRIEVISARTLYEQDLPDQHALWKASALRDLVIDPFFATVNTRKNLISIGDSNVERDAFLAVTAGRKSTLTKNIKLAAFPSLDRLKEELELVTQVFDSLYLFDGNLDVSLELKKDAKRGCMGGYSVEELCCFIAPGPSPAVLTWCQVMGQGMGRFIRHISAMPLQDSTLALEP